MAAIDYEASEWQTRFHTQRDASGRVVDEILGAGASGPGKTFTLLRDPLLQMQREAARQRLPKSHPDYVAPGESRGNALLLRRTTKMLRDLISQAKPLFKRWNGGVDGWNATDKTFTFECGYRYTLDHCFEVDDIENHVGVSWTWLGFDELIQFEEVQFQTIKLWVRSPDHVLSKDLRIRAATNPVFIADKAEKLSVRDPFWVRRYFVDPHPAGNQILRVKHKARNTKTGELETYDRTRLYMPATIDDNPDKQYVENQKRNLAQAPKHVQKALLYGDWYYQPGGYFEDAWDPDLHVVQPYRIPREWKVWRAMDWGFKTHGAVLWAAMDPDENIVIFKEYTFLGKTDEYVAGRIREIEERLGLWHKGQSLLTGPADTQLWEERGDTGVTKAKRMQQQGVPWRPATKGRQANAEGVYKRLTDWTQENPRPGLTVFSTCTETCKFAFSLPSDPKEPNVPLKGGNDHHYDTVSYLVRFAEKGSRAIPDHQSVRNRVERKSSGVQDAGVDGYGG